ncbi:MAG: hypothetical protein HYX28_03485 [Candidatus Koribacter versatilis]|uniref:Uncharacterized protein n=1 Tax=Candidatus Korobacter versatilis TaxID=658062 RepID=A0A932A7Z2_9BACT|nr:hypothetical protein [Candidatus Koribacter versatilis]
MEIWHRIWIDGKDVEDWRGRGLKVNPIRSAFYPDGTAKTWVGDVSESSSLWPEAKAYVGDRPHFLNTIFTDEERLAAEWCILRGLYTLPKPEGGYWSPLYYGGMCPVCGSGWTQIAPFRLSMEPNVRRNAFASLGGDELFSTDAVLSQFATEGVRGFEIQPVLINRERCASNNVKQVIASNVAGPALAEDLVEHEHFRSTKCACCGRTWHLYYSRGMLPLRRSALRSDVDFQMTDEWFGSGRAARREILVSRRVVHMILKNKWRGAGLAPVQVV